MNITKEEEEKIEKLQLLEQSRQMLNAQKQSFQARKMEIELALSEIEKTNEAYKIIGNIMLLSEKEKLKKELEEEKELINLRIKSIEKQEDSITQKMKNLQDEIIKKE
jgi:prefoldin beta subunit